MPMRRTIARRYNAQRAACVVPHPARARHGGENAALVGGASALKVVGRRQRGDTKSREKASGGDVARESAQVMRRSMVNGVRSYAVPCHAPVRECMNSEVCPQSSCRAPTRSLHSMQNSIVLPSLSCGKGGGAACVWGGGGGGGMGRGKGQYGGRRRANVCRAVGGVGCGCVVRGGVGQGCGKLGRGPWHGAMCGAG